MLIEMKNLIVLIAFTFLSVCCYAQSAHVPDSKAKRIHDRAVNTYLKYYNIADSVNSVLVLLDQALNIDSIYYTAWITKVGFECQQKQYTNALITCKKINHIFPNETDMIFFSGILEFKTGNNKDAINTFNELIPIYSSIIDTNNNTDHLKTAQLNKGIALKLVGKTQESKQLLLSLSMSEHDLAVRRHINTYITKSNEAIIDDLIATR